MKAEKLLQEARKLDVDQRTLLAHKIWKSVEEECEAAPLSEELKAELDRRLDALKKNPNDGMEWPEFRKLLRKEMKARRGKRA